MLQKYLQASFIISIMLFGLASGQPHTVQASIVDDLNREIELKTQRVKELEIEIAQYETEVAKSQEAKETLKSKLASLDATKKMLEAEIATTQTKIDSLGFTIEKLEYEIRSAEKSIGIGKSGLRDLLRTVSQEGSRETFEILLSADTLSSAWDKVETSSEVQRSIQENVATLTDARASLLQKKVQQEASKNALLQLHDTLADQRKIADQNKKSTSDLLKITSNKETSYRKLVEDKKTLKEQFEKDILDYESKLRFELDASSLPTGDALAWPISGKVYITQYFGQTTFAKRTAVYSGKGHNGIDLGAKIGTPILAASSGTVAGTGDTDLGCRGGSYGRWVLIKHTNGLATLYAHLSLIKVVPGQDVLTGDTIAYSGNTGYTTGPHLHFTVYASKAVSITAPTRADGSKSSCGPMPVAALNGYLNPLLYLKN